MGASQGVFRFLRDMAWQPALEFGLCTFLRFLVLVDFGFGETPMPHLN
jgi:hypothetical protein